MPIRNPFARRPGVVVSQEENLRPELANQCPGFERVDTVGSKASSVLSIRSARSQDTGEYKMSGMFHTLMCWPQAQPLPARHLQSLRLLLQ